MKIVFVMWRQSTFPKSFPAGPLGGAEAATWQIARELSSRHQIEIHCMSNNGKDEIQTLSIDGLGGREGVVTLRRIGMPLKSKWIKGDLYFAKSLRHVENTDIVQAISCLEPALYHPRTYLHLENELHPYLPYPNLKKKAYMKKLNAIRGVSGVSRYVAKNFITQLEYDGHVNIILNGADTQEYTPRRSDREYMNKQLGIAEDRTVITYAGAIHRRKGLHLLIKAYQKLSKKYDIQLLVLGGLFYSKKRREDIVYFEEQKQLMDKTHNLTFLGPVPRQELPRMLASSDIFVCPSIWNDPCPLVCAEAQASGLPVVGTKRGGIPDIVEHLKTGLICNPEIEDIHRSIEKLLKHPSNRRAQEKRARKRAQRALDWGKIASRMEKKYENY